MDEAQPGVSRGVDDLPPGKVKAWIPPNVPQTVIVSNNNDAHNPAHRDGKFQVKLHSTGAWSEDDDLAWGESVSFDTDWQPLAIRNNGRNSLTLTYE